MYGSIFRMRPKAGREGEITALFEEWGRTRAPQVKGVRAGYLLRPDNRTNGLIGVAIFDDKATYVANANDPAQNAWYLKLRDLLEADPAWEDGDYVVEGLAGQGAEQAVSGLVAAFNARDFDTLSRLVTPNYELVDVPSGTKLIGPEGQRRYWQGWLTAFPDGRIEDVRSSASPDGTVVTEFVGRGTQNGPLTAPGGQQIPATGRRVEVPFCQVARVSGGRITSARVYYDLATMLAQLGLGGATSSAPAGAQAKPQAAPKR